MTHSTAFSQTGESRFLPKAHKPHPPVPKFQLAAGDVICREALGVNSHSWAAQGQLQLAGLQPLFDCVSL